MSIAVFGATGAFGTLAVDALVARGVPAADLRALGRNPERLEALAARGLQTAAVDLAEPATLTPALAGVSTVLLVSSSEVGQRVAQHGNAVEAALAAGVGRIVYTSAPKATTVPHTLGGEHRFTEELLAERGVPHTVLRNWWYHENNLPAFQYARATGVLANSVGDGRTASASRADLAEAAAVVLTTDGHDGKVYELGGDTAWTWKEFAQHASDVLGREVVYQEVTPEQEAAGLLAAGLPEPVAGMLAAVSVDTRNGLVADPTHELSALLGRPTTPIEETMRAWV